PAGGRIKHLEVPDEVTSVSSGGQVLRHLNPARSRTGFAYKSLLRDGTIRGRVMGEGRRHALEPGGRGSKAVCRLVPAESLYRCRSRSTSSFCVRIRLRHRASRPVL